MRKRTFALCVAAALTGFPVASVQAADGYYYYDYGYNDYYYDYDEPRCPRDYTEQYDAARHITGCAPILSRNSRARPVHYNSSLYYWQCGNGYEIVYDDLLNKIGCRPSPVVRYAAPTYSNWYCPPGYSIAYDDLYNRIGCER